MPVQNPLSIPGGWKKDTPRDTPAGEEPNPVESQTIPRTPAGVVSETGGILDDAGRNVGKVTESEDGRSLEGNPVNAAGDVLDKTSGEVLGRASLESGDDKGQEEYTTGSQAPDDTQSQKSGSGVFGTIKSGMGYVGSLGGSKKSDAGTNKAPSEAPKAEGLDTENVQDTAKDATSEAPVDDSSIPQDTPDEVQDTADDAQNKLDETKDELTPEDSQSQAPGRDEVAQAGGEISLDDREKDASQANLDVTEKAGEAQEGLEDAKSQSNLNLSEKGAQVQEGVEEGVEEGKSQVSEKAAEAQEGVDETKSQVSSKAAEAQEGLDETKSQANLDAPETEQLEKDADDKTAPEVPEEASKVDETAEGAAETAEIPEEASKVDETAEGAAETAEGAVPAEGEEGEKPLLDFSILKGCKVDKSGNLKNKDGDVIGRLVEGDPEKLEGKRADKEGNIWNDNGKIIGKAEPLSEDERDEGEGKSVDFTVLKGCKVDKSGNLKNKDGDIVGRLVEGNPEKLEGKRADKDGNIWNDAGKIIGKAEPLSEEEREEGEGKKVDFTVLKGCKVNKAGNLVNDNGDVVGHVVEGDPKKLQGKRSDEEGNIWDDSGKIVGKAEPLSDGEREDRKKSFAPFENFPDAIVEADGRVLSEGRQVGVVVEGDPKRLKGSKVDEDGDILDRNGNTIGRAEAWDEPEPIPEEPEEIPDRSILAGKRVNKAGNVVDSAGVIFGKVVEGNVSSIVGRMCDKEGNIRSESGDVIGRAELVPEGEREGSKEGPFAELSGLTVRKDGMVVTPSDEVVGRLTSGDPKKLYGRPVDEDGDVVDKNGNVLGKAERYEEPEEEERKKGPLFGRKVNKEGNVVDEDGNLIGKLVSGEILACAGKEIDEDGDVFNHKGNVVGHVALIEDIPEPEPEPEETETEEQKKEREQAEADRKLAGQLAGCIEQSLEKIKPICKLITDKIDSAERTPKEELDEEQLVKEVKPLIEEGGKLLSETNGIVRGLDPDGRIQRQSKQRSGTKEATPEEHHLAEVLKELTGDVTQTVDNAKRKIEGMPHAKKELNPLWGLLMEPLGQILAAVGLLLTGVLGLVGKLLSGLGLGGLVDGLLGGLGLNKILGSLGLGSAYDALVGKKKK